MQSKSGCPTTASGYRADAPCPAGCDGGRRADEARGGPGRPGGMAGVSAGRGALRQAGQAHASAVTQNWSHVITPQAMCAMALYYPLTLPTRCSGLPSRAGTGGA